MADEVEGAAAEKVLGGMDEINSGETGATSTNEGSPKSTLEQAPDDVAEASAGASELASPNSSTGSIPEITGANVIGIQKIQNIKVRVQAMLGGISLSVSELANLKQGELLSLDTHVGDGIDILANGQLVARGEIVVVEGPKPRFGITLTEIVEAADMAS